MAFTGCHTVPKTERERKQNSYGPHLKQLLIDLIQENKANLVEGNSLETIKMCIKMRKIPKCGQLHIKKRKICFPNKT